MANYKHLSLDERKTIESMLNESVSLKKIARRIGRTPSTISRELLRNPSVERTGAVGQPFNNCANRRRCEQYRLCKKEDCTRQCCKACRFCHRLCPEFERENCDRLLLPPYVCNGCGSRHKCTLEKFVYKAHKAHMAYVHTLSFSRDGISITLEELMRIDAIVSPLIAKGQSVHSISVRHKDEIMLDEKTLYSYVKAGILTAKYIDLPNAVKMRPRKKKTEVKVERACRDGRSYRDFVSFMNENPDTAVVQMDSVEGLRGYGDPVLLTIHFVDAELMLAFRREANTAKSVADVVNSIYSSLGHDLFCSLFPLILTDLGPEFSNPSAIEMAPDGRKRTRLFYTDPGAPFQKGACENNHTLIRRVIPKGTPLKTFSQDDISLLMNHINSYSRKKLADKCPIDVFCFLHGASVLDAFGVTKIPPDLVTLKPSLLKN